MIRSDIENLKGVIKWRALDEKQAWQIDTLKISEGNLACKNSQTTSINRN